MLRVLSVIAGSAGLLMASVAPALAQVAPLGNRIALPILPVGGLLGVAAVAVVGGIYLTRRKR